MRKIFNKKAGHLILAGMLAFGSTTFLTKCMFGDDGGSSKSNTTCQEDDTTCGGGGDPEDPEDPVDDGSTIVDDNGVERIVLAQDFNTFAANDIEPVEIYEEGDSRNVYEGYTFKKTYVYNMYQVNGKKVIFDGEVNNTGQVDKRILINGSEDLDGNAVTTLKNTDILAENTQLTTGASEGTNSIYMDVPSNPISPLYPFYDYDTGGIRLLQTGRLSDQTTVSVPTGSKLSYSGNPTVVFRPFSY